MENYDVVVIGSGPAGLTSAIYAVRGGLSTLIVEKGLTGGQIALTENIENYPGFESISGAELAKKMLDQAKNQGAVFELEEVKSISEDNGKKIIDLGEKKVSAKAVVIAVGSNPRKLGVPGEKEFDGKGVHYCALCDGFAYRNKVVAVLGGGDAAIKEALYLANTTKKVYVIHRRDELRAEKGHQEQAFAKENIEFIWDSVVTEFVGTKFLEKLKIHNVKTNKDSEIAVDGSFTYVGHLPATNWVDVDKTERGYIKVDKKMSTSMQGVFACGDCTDGDIAQIATSVGDGAIAGTSVIEYVQNLKNGKK
ncbi:MAG: thioredoxin-disulfide reductase [archaeon]|jgi:thioredoxin reductase (NADPH)